MDFPQFLFHFPAMTRLSSYLSCSVIGSLARFVKFLNLRGKSWFIEFLLGDLCTIHLFSLFYLFFLFSHFPFLFIDICLAILVLSGIQSLF